MIGEYLTRKFYNFNPNNKFIFRKSLKVQFFTTTLEKLTVCQLEKMFLNSRENPSFIKVFKKACNGLILKSVYLSSISITSLHVRFFPQCICLFNFQITIMYQFLIGCQACYMSYPHSCLFCLNHFYTQALLS